MLYLALLLLVSAVPFFAYLLVKCIDLLCMWQDRNINDDEDET